MTPQQIAASVLVDIQENERKYSADYWVGYLLATLERIVSQQE